MLKILLVFTLLFTVFPLQAYGHPAEAQQTTNRDKPALPTPTIPVDEKDSQKLQAESADHVSADVRVVSVPDKDIYDRVLFWANIALASVGIIGIGVGVCTLLFIRAQVVEMRHQRILMARTLLTIRKQTKATEDAVEASNTARASSEDTAKRQLRAYLCISKGRINFKEDSYWEPQLHIVNGGQTPAYEVRTWIDTAVREFPTWGPLQLEIPKDALQAVGIIPPQGESIMVSRRIPKAVADDTFLQTRYKILYVFGEITYKDAFGQSRFTNFRLIFGGPVGCRRKVDQEGVLMGFLSMDSEGNEAN